MIDILTKKFQKSSWFTRKYYASSSYKATLISVQYGNINFEENKNKNNWPSLLAFTFEKSAENSNLITKA